MKFEDGENNFIFLIAPRIWQEHRVASKVPQLRQLLRFCFPLRFHSTAVSIIPPVLWISMLLHLVSRKQGGRKTWEIWKQSSALRMSWSNGLKDTFTLYVLSLIMNQLFNSYINLLHFFESPIKLCTVNTSQCLNFYRDRIWIGRPVFDLTLYSPHPDVL